MTDELARAARVPLTLAVASRRLPAGDKVHTYREASLIMMGADWDRGDLLAHIETHGAEESGPIATAAGYGMCVTDERGRLWIACEPDDCTRIEATP